MLLYSCFWLLGREDLKTGRPEDLSTGRKASAGGAGGKVPSAVLLLQRPRENPGHAKTGPLTVDEKKLRLMVRWVVKLTVSRKVHYSSSSPRAFAAVLFSLAFLALSLTATPCLEAQPTGLESTLRIGKARRAVNHHSLENW